jgi:hypothetical protein
MFSHTFLLFQLLIFFFSVFAKLLLTNFFAPFLAAGESHFLSRFSYLWHSEQVHLTCAPRSHVAEWLSDVLSSRSPGFKTSAWRT